MNLSEALQNGSPWVVLVCVLMFVGVAVALFTERGSGITRHPYTKAADGGALASDLPAEALGRAELEPLLWGHRRPCRAGRRVGVRPALRRLSGRVLFRRPAQAVRDQ